MKRIISVLLAFMLLCTALPAAFAADDSWICPICDGECTRNFCPNGRMSKPQP